MEAVSFFPIFQAFGSIFSAVMSSGAQSNAGAQAAEAAYYNEQVARNNAIAAQNAAAADAKQQDTVNQQRLGSMTAGIGKSGAEFEGTPLMLLSDETAQGSLAKQKILYRGQVQANNFLSQAQQDEFTGQQAQSSGNARAGSTLLTGVLDGVGKGIKGYGIGGQ